jgi:hypothetical protein
MSHQLTHRRTAVLALAALLALGAPMVSACGSAVQGAVEKAAGDAIGGNVDINSNGLSVTDSNGNQIQIGEDVAMPDNWPSAVPKFDGGKLASVMVAGDGASVNAMWTTDASADEAAKAYNDALLGAGFTQEQSMAAGGVGGGTYSGNGYKVNVVVTGADGQTTVLVNAEKA